MSDIISWDKTLGKKAKSSDNEDVGTVENTTPDSIEVKDGLIAKKHYYIPKIYVVGFNGDDLMINLKKDEIRDRFLADNPVADLWRAPKD
ncbi:MAG: hypothetical protein DLM72_14180 [Candidatus Nitrosopolaris wilkensis]|nr:MAG: hypothetical protein DLM72_14180 [Candidatus Nitrosopolaris wilkensis]